VESVVAMSWTKLTATMKVKRPSLRAYVGMVEEDGQLFVFGGGTGLGGETNKLFSFEPNASTWTDWSALAHGTAPAARLGPDLAATNGVLYMLGGVGGNGLSQDLFALDTKSKTWEQDVGGPFDGAGRAAGGGLQPRDGGG